jgi:hypothetical protein
MPSMFDPEMRSHECRGLFVTDLNETDFIGALVKRFHDVVDAIAGQSENHVNACTIPL